MNISTEMICYIIALPIVTLFIGIMIGGHEARKESHLTHTNTNTNRTQRELRAQYDKYEMQNRKNA